MITKILHFNNQEDKDFINNNPIFKKDFEDLCNWPNRSETSDQLFENFKNRTFVIALLDNHIISMACGWKRKDHLTIADVFTSINYRGKGGCRSVIGALLNYWWDKKKLQFKDDLSIEFGVTHDNISAIKCYQYFGFIEIPDSYTYAKTALGEDVKRIKMILTKESYAKTYLLQIYKNKLQSRLNHKYD